jgi:hypothetical protein
MASWLSVIGTRPVHLDHFANAHDYACDPLFVSYADLKPTAIWQIETNLQNGRSFCDGYHKSWSKPSNLFEPTGDARNPALWATHAHRMMRDWPFPTTTTPSGLTGEEAVIATAATATLARGGALPSSLPSHNVEVPPGGAVGGAAATPDVSSTENHQGNKAQQCACSLSVAVTDGVLYMLVLLSAVLTDAYPECDVSIAREGDLDPVHESVDILVSSVLDGSATGTGISLLTSYFVLEYLCGLTTSYWNIFTDEMLCTGIFPAD